MRTTKIKRIEKLEEQLQQLKKEVEQESKGIVELGIVELTGMPFKIGKAYFIRTVTYHLTGRIKGVVGQFLVLEDAAWIADSGRFMTAIDNGTLNEVEPVKCEVYVNVNSISDAFEWNHALPRTQK